MSILSRMLLALAFGVAVSMLYRITGPQDRGNRSRLASSLVLLSVLIAMVTQVVGDSVARAFSLVGALSVVRFRTPLEDTRDTAFVLFAVILGMAVGVGQPLLAGIGFGIGAIAAAGYRFHAGSDLPRSWQVEISRTAALATASADLTDTLRGFCTKVECWATRIHKKGECTEFRYQITPRIDLDPSEIIALLTAIDGVQSVEISPSK
ncbi:Uncharacterized protein OS=Planctomyces limnophilus (strain ATCC 43296 / DSM 3776 / IFAM 1008 / 290) GN=Plim_3170 PE=4 SV=1 [Tuwongella immobilis]|uniref:DUF4956 domain-containing protein n=2 Tax=Tuwongella immobilis TaxID=692036 RepID=A0A6C2YIZ5_9BACT|nr:Uncharacterized protein OS=Planctomyces limnophilus (strain ATCC 43296 / DSM 3776 / IFAM 1008 / 290) GN=Plim_3170 PE=4 SV=1 [Tuwongella immobilis]VTR97535.1 Uncharacterized protein OS=Planctomyces limnophilus (strain ATCC 43296 / DSM 3776 / IFAM 1008 / 290) GN=Plim_3170 PE=4 SV=1 [Tuwongella immobilis]